MTAICCKVVSFGTFLERPHYEVALNEKKKSDLETGLAELVRLL